MTETTFTLPKSTKWDITYYGTNFLLNKLLFAGDLKNDAALARVLEVAPPVISKLRNNKLRLGASLIIRMHEVFGLSITEIKYLATQEAP